MQAQAVLIPPLLFSSSLITPSSTLTPCKSSRVTPKIRAKIKNQHLSVDHQHIHMAASVEIGNPKWAQKTLTIPAQRRGCHLITSKILKEIGQDLCGYKCGVAHFFLKHTSASLTVNENYDSDVRYDTETFLNRVVPEGTSAPWKHTLEGPDDMPAHIKSSMFGCSLSIPITDGKLNMGTWQGIWLCEHRDAATPRNIVVVEFELGRNYVLTLGDLKYHALSSALYITKPLLSSPSVIDLHELGEILQLRHPLLCASDDLAAVSASSSNAEFDPPIHFTHLVRS